MFASVKFAYKLWAYLNATSSKLLLSSIFIAWVPIVKAVFLNSEGLGPDDCAFLGVWANSYGVSIL